jgi:MYXO-CTERM domain-containing protein
MVVVAAGLVVAGCAEPGSDEEYSQTESYATVAGYTTSSCSTAVVIGLSKQIADEVGCANPTGLVKLNPGGNLQLTSNAVLPYLAMKAKTDIEAVAQGRVVQINSAFRTVAQQYLLYRWYQLGRCGITAAATPGNSNHESGRALDLANYSAVISAMGARGWAHDVPGDAVHFDHLSSPDIRGRDVLAFQKLWNRNHPEDMIGEDGDYGPTTEIRIRMAPAEGFPIGPNCLGTRELEVVGVDGPDRVAPATKVHYAMTLRNSGTATWPATTKLQLATGTTSPLHDASWTSQTVVATLGAPIAPMSSGTIDFDVMTPMATEELPVAQDLVLDDNGQKFGDIQFALTVVPGGGGDSGDGSEFGDDVQGGCSTGGGSTGALVMLGFVGLRLRRRRR